MTMKSSNASSCSDSRRPLRHKTSLQCPSANSFSPVASHGDVGASCGCPHHLRGLWATNNSGFTSLGCLWTLTCVNPRHTSSFPRETSLWTGVPALHVLGVQGQRWACHPEGCVLARRGRMAEVVFLDLSPKTLGLKSCLVQAWLLLGGQFLGDSSSCLCRATGQN